MVGEPRRNVRTDFGQAMEGLRFPADREELIRQARANGVDDQIIETLSHMPEGVYRSREDVQKDVGDND